MIKSNTKVLFIKVAQGGKSELARAGTCATERSQNSATRVSGPNWEMWYQMAVQARKSKKLHHMGEVQLRRIQEQGRQAHQKPQEQGHCEAVTCGLLAGMSGTSGTMSPHLGMDIQEQQAVVR